MTTLNRGSPSTKAHSGSSRRTNGFCVLVVGQTPPPYGGQAMMIENLLAGDYGTHINVHHVRMSFSTDMREVGKFRLRKLFGLASLIARIVLGRIRHGADALYYPPAPAKRVPLYRDLAVLLTTRWLFKRTIFHFHASGISQLERTLPRIMRTAYRLAYRNPDVAIRPSAYTVDDGAALGATLNFVVPNGIPDMTTGCAEVVSSNPATILFVGVVCEEKGVGVALDACQRLRDRGLSFRFNFVGRFESREYQSKVLSYVEKHGLAHSVSFAGELTGTQKLEAFARASIFCFPTYVEGETFGLVAAEAMSFGLPVVATRWVGVQSVVDDGVTGFLVPIKDPATIAERLETLLTDGKLRKAMGERGRARFLERFTVAEFHHRIAEVFWATAQLGCEAH